MFSDLERYGSAVALVEEGRAVPYRELVAAADRVAAAVGQRALVFLFCTNTAASIAGYVGFLRHRIVPVMVDAALDAGLAAHLIEVYHPAFLWLPEGRAEAFGGRVVLRLEGYALVAREVAAPFPLHDDLALLMTTSGSTGSPKLVRQSYANLAANTSSILEYLHIAPEERAITNLPMHYVYGLSIINTHLAAGASIVVTQRTLFDRAFWSLVREARVTSLAGVPYTYAMLARLRFFRMDLPDVRTLTQAGGKLDPELHEKFARWAEENGRRFVVMYGAAEATARMGWLPPELSLAKAGAMGCAIPGGRFSLVDEEGAVIEAAGVTGELVYEGANVALGYATCGADLAKGDEWHGRYVTGDMAQRDADGIYTIVGRRKRFLKIFGKRTNLEEAEHLLRQQFPGAEVACAGRDDEMHVYTTAQAIVDGIVPFLSAKLGLHPSAFRARLVAEIPKNTAGKTLYRELENMEGAKG
ncbi:AMP-binding protein [uncultured Selenomonas sp.]|uniref:AMP-binding protein n=1 Tax=uncultured Selenomonas sp. TaxID=159275 RepID=UPI0025EC73FF|nr:AMP-binding protein [uncultured Selenomonas sp.]